MFMSISVGGGPNRIASDSTGTLHFILTDSSRRILLSPNSTVQAIVEIESGSTVQAVVVNGTVVLNGSGSTVQAVFGTGTMVLTGSGSTVQAVFSTGSTVQAVLGTATAVLQGSGSTVQAVFSTGSTVQALIGTATITMLSTGTMVLAGTGSTVQAALTTTSTVQAVLGVAATMNANIYTNITTTSTRILASNTTRTGYSIFNIEQPVRIGPSTAALNYYLYPGMSYNEGMPGVYTGVVFAIAEATASTISVIETQT